MRKSRESLKVAKALVNPVFAWSNALLKGGEMMLDSMAAAARQAKAASVAVIPTVDAPAPRRARRKAKSSAKGKRRAGARRRS